MKCISLLVDDCGQVLGADLSTVASRPTVSRIYSFIHKLWNMWISCWQASPEVRRITFLSVDKM